MAVLLETSKGDLTIDLFVNETPKAATNFLKCGLRGCGAPHHLAIAHHPPQPPTLPAPVPHRLCKAKYYNNCLFFNVQTNFIAQTGDPTNTGRGGESVWGLLYGEQARFFEDEIRPGLKHKRRGLVGMASECGTGRGHAGTRAGPCAGCAGGRRVQAGGLQASTRCGPLPGSAQVLPASRWGAAGARPQLSRRAALRRLRPAGKGEDMNASQFYITLEDNLHSLDEKHTIFGEVAEGLEVLEAINDVPCDKAGRPLQNIRCGRGGRPAADAACPAPCTSCSGQPASSPAHAAESLPMQLGRALSARPAALVCSRPTPALSPTALPALPHPLPLQGAPHHRPGRPLPRPAHAGLHHPRRLAGAPVCRRRAAGGRLGAAGGRAAAGGG